MRTPGPATMEQRFKDPSVRPFLAPHPSAKQTDVPARGTEGSIPPSSTGESDANLTFSAQTRPEFRAALENADIDLILADYKLPSDGLFALKLGRTARPDPPFIFVSGTLGEAVELRQVDIHDEPIAFNDTASGRAAPLTRRWRSRKPTEGKG